MLWPPLERNSPFRAGRFCQSAALSALWCLGRNPEKVRFYKSILIAALAGKSKACEIIVNTTFF